jgi:hypothetical protein
MNPIKTPSYLNGHNSHYFQSGMYLNECMKYEEKVVPKIPLPRWMTNNRAELIGQKEI